MTFWFGVPRRFIPSGVAFDVDRNALSSAAKDDDRTRWIAFNRSYNQVLSAHEHSVLEDMFSTPTQPVLGVSTVKAIAVAAQQGQRIYTITQDNLATALSQISLPADVETDIANAVNAGFQVTTHQADIQYAGLITAGYAIEDPNTGVGAMLISSGDSGGIAILLAIIDWAVFITLGAAAIFPGVALFLGPTLIVLLTILSIVISVINLINDLECGGLKPSLGVLAISIIMPSVFLRESLRFIVASISGFLVSRAIPAFANTGCRP